MKKCEVFKDFREKKNFFLSSLNKNKAVGCLVFWITKKNLSKRTKKKAQNKSSETERER